MLLPIVPTLLNLLIFNVTSDGFSLVHQSCLADQYHGTYGDQNLFMPDSEFHRDFELNFGLRRKSGLIPVHPHLFVKRMEIQDAISDEDTLLGGLGRLVSYTTNDPATLGTQQPLTMDTPIYSIPYTCSPDILRTSLLLLLHIIKTHPPSCKAYVLPKIPFPFHRVSDEARERIIRWTTSVQYEDDIGQIVDRLSIAELRKDVRYLTGEDPDSPILSRSSFSEGGRLAAEWILEQIEKTGAECELKQFLIGFAPNVVWCVTSHQNRAHIHGRLPLVSTYESLDESAGTIIVSSHYDSRGSLGNPRAPGGNDNGG